MDALLVFITFLLPYASAGFTTSSTIRPRNLPEHPTLDMTVMPKLRFELKGVTLKWNIGWAVRVMHSPDSEDESAYLCTATCIEERIFVTAARCIYRAKVLLTTVVIDNERLQAIAFVTPSNPTKAMFDDIGFIVVNDTPRKRKWEVVGVLSSNEFPDFTRTDEHFIWFERFAYEFGAPRKVYVIGYIKTNGKSWDQYLASELFISPFLCQHFYNPDIVRQQYKSDNYFVPCYHTCHIDQGYNKTNCDKRRFAGEGFSVIYHYGVTYRLLGVATWGGRYSSLIGTNLPVGFATTNSKNFFEDWKCAQEIKKANATRNSFADLCT